MFIISFCLHFIFAWQLNMSSFWQRSFWCRPCISRYYTINLNTSYVITSSSEESEIDTDIEAIYWRFVFCFITFILEKSASHRTLTARKMEFSIKDFFSKCDQIHRKLQIWSHFLKKSLMENFIFCTLSFVLSLLGNFIETKKINQASI